MTTVFVATMGGHVAELVALAGRLVDTDDALWITNDSPQTRDLLRDERVEFVPFVAERDLAGVARAAIAANRLFASTPVDRVVSTGSALALGYLPVAAARGIDAHYIESSTRIQTCSLTGQILARTPRVRCWWQYDPAPDRFHHLAGVYDRYVTVDAIPSPEQTTGIERVVVTVGTTDRCFRRLIERLVAVLPAETEVLWQTGASNVDGLDIEARPSVPESELVAAAEAADAVITHAGAGSLGMALAAGKVPVFVPRRAVHGEQPDDHQVELADWADAAGLAIKAEADRVDLTHLERAAARHVLTEPERELVLQ